ncbi:hypothetical protein PHLCEN_2v12299 [Hermanssonia centrifuga]|uniref:Uncharacterized protein n=1 Tax=Hermanssonia centrifuga TaxID=98765 RepID=A0A2R6NHS2_9APHY|nr:hypothetical protein PHLCEN_2v12299 [Hermanssonia centrifuga]
MSTEMHYLSSDATYHGLPDGWVMHVHPQGWVYFRNAEHRMVVDEDIRDPAIFEKFSACFARWQPQGLLPDDFELHVLSLVNLKYSLIINHTQHVAGFNLEKAILREPLHTLSVPKSSRLRRLYWNYVQQHPVHVSVPKHAVVEARDALQALFLGK